MEHEVVVNGIILRIFNRNPAIYLQHDFSHFIESLLNQMNNQISKIATLNEMLISGEIEH